MGVGNGRASESFDLAMSAPMSFPMAGAERQAPPPSIFAILYRRWLTAVLVGIFLAGASVACVYYFVKPKYKVTATIHISPVTRAILDAQADPIKWGDYRQYVGTQALTLASTAIIDKLLTSPEIRSLPSLAPLENPTNMIQKNLEARQIQSSELMEVSMVGANPDDMVAIVNGLIATYLQHVEDKEDEWHRKLVGSLKTELGELEAKLKFKNQQLLQVAVEEGASGAEGSGLLIDKWLSDAHQLLSQANKERALAEAKLAALGDGDPSTADPAMYEEFVARDLELIGLKEQYRKLKSEAAADASLGRGPLHPDVIARPQIMAELEERMKKREESLVRTFAVSQKRELESQFRTAEITARVYESELKKLQSDRTNVAGSQFLLNDLANHRLLADSLFSQPEADILTDGQGVEKR